MPRLQGVGGGLAAAVLGRGIKVVVGVEGLLGAEGYACRMVGRRRVELRRLGERRVGKTSALFGRRKTSQLFGPTCSLLALVYGLGFRVSVYMQRVCSGCLLCAVGVIKVCSWCLLCVVRVSCVQFVSLTPIPPPPPHAVLCSMTLVGLGARGSCH